jgi:hypothetical protein
MTPETRDEPFSPANIPFDHQPGAPPIIERPDLPAMVAVGDVSLTRAAAKKKMTMRDAPAADTGGQCRVDGRHRSLARQLGRREREPGSRSSGAMLNAWRRRRDAAPAMSAGAVASVVTCGLREL